MAEKWQVKVTAVAAGEWVSDEGRVKFITRSYEYSPGLWRLEGKDVLTERPWDLICSVNTLVTGCFAD
jgi:hypothetical protein